MKKLIQSILMLIISLSVLAFGIYAATIKEVNFNNTKNAFTFTSNGCYVDIKGYRNVDAAPEYEEKTYTSVDKLPQDPTAWTLGTIQLSERNFAHIITVVFTNEGDSKVQITISTPSFTNPIYLTGGYVGNDGTTTTAVGNVATMQKRGDVAIYRYVISLVDYKVAVASTEFSFSAAFAPVN